MAESKHQIFKEMIFILDGDCKKKYKLKNIPSKTVILPVEYRPESIFYNYLLNLSDEDEFWNEEKNFTRQICFSDYQTETYDKGIN